MGLPERSPAQPIVSATAPSELEELSEFLGEMFNEHGAPWFRPDVLKWKYFGVDWPGPESFIARIDHRLVGHIGLARRALIVRRERRSERVHAVHFLDWAARPDAGFAGALLCMRALSGVDIAYQLGGSADSRAVLRAAGYAPCESIPSMGRVLNPWRRLGRTDRSLWRSVAAGVRDMARAATRSPKPPRAHLTVRRVEAFGPEVADIMQRIPGPLAFVERSSSLLNHFVRCPMGEIKGWHLVDGKRVVGIGLTSIVAEGDSRIGRLADCVLDTRDIDTWHAAVNLLTRELSASRADLVKCYASAPWIHAACARAGFRVEREHPLLMRGLGTVLPADLPRHITNLEADHALR